MEMIKESAFASFGSQTAEYWSTELNDCFDRSGFSEKARKYRREAIDRLQILRNYIQKEYPVNFQKVMGSRAEGTSLFYESPSDTDVISCYSCPLIGDDLIDMTSTCIPDDIPYLICKRESTTPAGYTKLQLFMNGRPCTLADENIIKEYIYHGIVIDDRERLMLSNNIKDHVGSSWEGMRPEYHGPAVTFENNSGVSFDSVPAFSSAMLPKDFDKWLDRPRPYDWPSPTTCSLLKTMDFFVVGIGHANSPEQHLEWRISFSNQELFLMLTLNPTQYRCYILLKTLKKMLKKVAADHFLSSYHCKTALFYTIEKNKRDIWTPVNLIACVVKCLEQLNVWLSQRNCPNYFIPEENMFETKITNEDQVVELQNCIMHLLRKESSLYMALISFARKFVPENLVILHESLLVKDGVQLQDKDPPLSLIKRKVDTIEEKLEAVRKDDHDYINLFDIICPLNLSRDSVVETLERAYDFLQKALLMKTVNESKENLTSLEKYMFQNNLGPADNILCRLKVASTYFKFGMNSKCDKILLSILAESKNVHRLCICETVCGTKQKRRLAEELNISEIPPTENSAFDIMPDLMLCLNFQYYELGVVPVPLIFEAYRTFGGQHSEDLHFFEMFWYDKVIMDPMVYAYFLLYKNSEILGETVKMNEALAKLEELSDRHLLQSVECHRETNLNMLGHIYLTRGWPARALKCFEKSWNIRPFYNAAKWHILFMLFAAIDSC